MKHCSLVPLTCESNPSKKPLAEHPSMEKSNKVSHMGDNQYLLAENVIYSLLSKASKCANAFHNITYVSPIKF